jgi:hypothetical protein
MVQRLASWVLLGGLAACGSGGGGGPFGLEATAEVRDEGQPSEAMVVTLVTDPKASIWCKDCKQTASGMSVGGDGHLEVVLETSKEGPPAKHCFKAMIPGTDRAAPDVCVEPPMLDPGLVVETSRFYCTRVKCDAAVTVGGMLTVGEVQPGATLTVGGQGVSTQPGTQLDLHLATYLPSLTLDQIRQRTVVATIPFSIAFADGQTASGNLALDADVVFDEDALSAIDKGPVKLGDEPAGKAPARPRGIAIVPASRAFTIAEDVVGPATKLVELDQIVKVTRVARVVQRCPYHIADTGEDFTMTRVANDLAATAYDRRTGKVLDRHSFRAKDPAPCPAEFTVTDTKTPDGYALTQDAPADDVVAWAKTRL